LNGVNPTSTHGDTDVIQHFSGLSVASKLSVGSLYILVGLRLATCDEGIILWVAHVEKGVLVVLYKKYINKSIFGTLC
jgi:hypothetical protein